MAADQIVIVGEDRVSRSPIPTISLTTETVTGAEFGAVQTDGNGVFVTNTHYSLDDGDTWIERDYQEDVVYSKVWDGSRFVIPYHYLSGGPPSTFVGMSWTATGEDTVNASNGVIAANISSNFIYFDGYYLLGGLNGTNTYYNDEVTGAFTTGSGAGLNNTQHYFTNGSRVVAISATDDEVAWTDDLTGSWTMATTPSPTVKGHKGIWDGSRWIITGRNGGDTAFIWAESSNASTWTVHTGDLGDMTPVAIAAYNDIAYLVYYDNGDFTYNLASLSGTTWTVEETDIGEVTSMCIAPVPNIVGGARARVFDDVDADSVFEANDVAIEGVNVTLLHDSDANGSYETTIGTIASDGYGWVFFPNLDDGDYRLSLGSLTTGFVNNGTTNRDFEVAEDTTTINYSIDAPSVSGTYFFDVDADGINDSEEGVSYSITLRDAATNGIDYYDETVSDENGLYSFRLVPADDYIIRFLVPDYYEPTTGDPGPGPVDIPVTISAGEDHVENLGIATSTISIYVFLDEDLDGVEDGGPAPAHVVRLDNNAETQETTNGSGYATFSPIYSDTYSVSVIPATYLTTPHPVDVTVGVGQTETVEFGFYTPKTLTLSILQDTDYDGDGDDLWDDELSLIEELLVERFTDGDWVEWYSGYFTVDIDVASGDYRISLTFIDGYNYRVISDNEITITTLDDELELIVEEFAAISLAVIDDTDDTGVEDATVVVYFDSVLLEALSTDVDGEAVSEVTEAGLYEAILDTGSLPLGYLPVNGTTRSATRTAAQAWTPTPFLVVLGGLVYGQIWDDINGDRLYNDGGGGVEGVVVGLYNNSNVLVATQVSDVNGEWSFGYQLPGEYQIRVVSAPGSYVATTIFRRATVVSGGDHEFFLGVSENPISDSGWGFLPVR